MIMVSISGFVVSVIIILLAILLEIRNEIVYYARGRASDYVFSQPNWKELQPALQNASYSMMIIDLRKWTFKQFYPTLWRSMQKQN